ncbi:ParA family protein [Nitrogeniibacter aestuarii]|uniref:ParA family protein n=1 Tax=Nitrogeniibacter aestuarii TaxID=2815343 RepID=UPI001E3C1523|nr:ParA family protein [Nitrogeniibacter aestuarii]
MKTLAIANQKGGVGKTTVARNLMFWAVERGLRTLAVDLDPQRNFTKTLLSLRERNLDLEAVPEPQALATHLFASDQDPVPMDCGQGAALIAATRDLVDVAAMPLEALHEPRAALGRLAEGFDLCILDTAPTLGSPLYAALIAADCVLCPCTVDQDATDGLQDLMSDIARVQQLGWNPSLKLLGVLANNVNRRRAFDMQGLTALKDALPQLMLSNTLFERAATKYAKDHGVWQSLRGESTSRAAVEMKAACKEIMDKMGVPYGRKRRIK